MKKIIILTLCILLLMGGCASGRQDQYRTEFIDTFDTVVTVIGYADSQEEFTEMAELIYDNFKEMHQLFDIYHDYEGINNIKTINDSAGIQPVKVDARIINLIQSSKTWYEKTEGMVNIAMGPVLNIWHDARQAALTDPSSAKLPTMETLQEAAKYTDISKVVVDEANSTVYIEEGMRLDVGAVAKGYVTQVVSDILESKGYNSVLISAGGNVKAIGMPKDGVRTRWGVGIKDPQSTLAHSLSEENLLDVAFVKDTSVVSSGSYERFFEVDGIQYHHLIDPKTLMPATHYTGVTIITPNSATADILSTAIFLLPPDKAKALVENMDDAEAMWITEDGEVTTTKGMTPYLRDMGGAVNK